MHRKTLEDMAIPHREVEVLFDAHKGCLSISLRTQRWYTQICLTTLSRF
jgi:hypothetical protein